jgi:hypothetical protein
MFVFLPLHLNAEMSVGDYEKLSLQEKESLKLYMYGVGVGISWANVQLKGPQKLYCDPQQLVINADNYLSILEKQILYEKKLMPLKYKEFPIEMYLIQGLVRVFPCK